MTDAPLTPGHRLNSAVIRRDLYRLLSAFLAIGPVRACANGPQDPLRMLHEFCAEDEITYLLVSTAVMNRSQLDHMHKLRHDPDEKGWQPLEGTCGTLWPKTGDDRNKPLLLRDASDKIIHATSVEIVEPAKSRLQLCGRHRNQEWIAMIEVIDYVRLSVRNFDDALA